MKFLRIFGVAGALLVVSVAVAQQAATVTPAPEPAPATIAPLAEAKPATFGDATAGAAKAGACAACHGVDGNSADPQYPKLAGQHERFIYRQLKLFKSGERNNAIMMGMAAALSEQDMRDIGAYFATQKVVAGVADDTPIASGPNQGRKFYEVGQKIFRAGKASAGVPACLACHGPAGRGNPGPSYPALGGQHSEYSVARLTAFRGGEVWGKDANANIIMSGVARNLSDEEIQGLATYLQGLHEPAPVAAK